MDFLNQVQGSKEWLNERKKRIGGSEIAAILGISPWTSPYQLWAQKIGLVEPEDISNKPHVVRGVLAEPVARDKFNKAFVPRVWPVVGGFMGASDDGYNEITNEILEIKTMGEQAHEDAKSGEIPDYYKCQMIWNLGVSGASKCYFISVRPESDYELAVVEVLPDPKAFAEMTKKALEFWELVKTKTAPELTDKDIMDLTEDAVFRETAETYRLKLAKLKLLEIETEELKAILIGRMQGRPAVKCPELKLTRYTRAGNINYSAVPELKDVDLEPYRKPPTIAFKLTLA